jgi:hypothetical protein
VTNPDRPHDATQAAADALLELGRQPGADPVQQLRHVAAELIQQRHQAQTAFAEMTPGGRQHAEQALAVADLFGQCATALLPLAETQLDGFEQDAIAEHFGLDRPEDRP